MKTKWMKKSDEWIKSHPGEPTMYKVFIDDNGKNAGPAPIDTPQTIITKHKENRGVYVIVCEPSKRAYIGQSENIPNRLRNHKMNIISDSDTKSSVYIKMREDRRLYGIDSFKFHKHLSVINGGITHLLDVENQTMIEFMEKGYELYNKSVSAKNLYCPEPLRSQIAKIIAIMQADYSASVEFEALILKNSRFITDL